MSAPKTPEDWMIRLNARGQGTDTQPLSESERKDLARWLVANPENFKQLKLARLVWGLGARLPSGAASGIDLAKAAGLSTRLGWALADMRDVMVRPGAFAGAAVAAALAAFLFFGKMPDPSHLQNHTQTQTGIGQISSYVLPDNSNITMAANSSVEVDFSAQHRTIHLERGEVFLSVQHDSSHPFVIATGTHEVVVTGTRFNVNYDRAQNSVEVAVVEGSINVVRHADAGAETQHMGAGEVILFPASGSPVRRHLTPEQAAAWRNRQLYFDDAKLSDVLTEVNRYTAKPLVADSTDARTLTLTGQFVAGDIDTLLFSLQKLYGVVARDQGDHLLLTRTKAR